MSDSIGIVSLHCTLVREQGLCDRGWYEWHFSSWLTFQVLVVDFSSTL